MLRNTLRLTWLVVLLIVVHSVPVAQNYATTSTTNGVLIDYPDNWEVIVPDEFDNIVRFISGSMSIGFSIVPIEFVDEIPEGLIEFFIDDIEDDDLGEFGEPEEYEIAGKWQAFRTQRVRTDTRLIEVLIATEINGLSVFVRGSFRIGAQEFFLPTFDTMLSTIRNVDDEIVITSGSTAQRPLTSGLVGSIVEPLAMGALNTNYITQDEIYQFDYPSTWDIRTESDGSMTIIERENARAILFAELIILPIEASQSLSALVTERFDDDVILEDMMLNDLPAIRVHTLDESNNVRRLVIATTRGDVQTIIDATISLDAPADTDSILRAMLYSVRPNGEILYLSIVGTAVREGLASASIYGTARIPDEITVDGLALDNIYITRNGRFTFNYPSEWFELFENGLIVISNDDDIDIFDPGRNDVQLIINFIENSEDFLEEDESTAFDILNSLIEGDDFPNAWSDITQFESLGRDAAYADLEIFDTDLIGRIFYIKLDELDDIFARVDVVADEDDFQEFELIVLSIIETIRFQD